MSDQPPYPPPPPPPPGGGYGGPTPPPPPPPDGGYGGPPAGGYPPAPPPPGGGYPPPPPPGGGYPPPPPGAGYPPQASSGAYYGGQVGGQLAEWPQRALGYLVDAAFALVIVIAGLIVGAIFGVVSSALGTLVGLVFYLGALAYFIIQLVKQGNTGQTIGKKVMGLRVVNEGTGQPIGPGMSIVRYLAHIVDSLICYIGWLFPLWDPKKQTIADKLVGTVVYVVPKQPFNTMDLYTTT